MSKYICVGVYFDNAEFKSSYAKKCSEFAMEDGKGRKTPNVEIVDSNGEKVIYLHSRALNFIEMYVNRIIEKNADEIFNAVNAKENSIRIKGNETKEIIKNTYEKIGLAGKIKEKCKFKWEIQYE